MLSLRATTKRRSKQAKRLSSGASGLIVTKLTTRDYFSSLAACCVCYAKNAFITRSDVIRLKVNCSSLLLLLSLLKQREQTFGGKSKREKPIERQLNRFWCSTCGRQVFLWPKSISVGGFSAHT